MPKISEFYGIVITMFHNDHAPPHSHASYAEHEAWIGIQPVRFLYGNLPRPQLRLVLAWAEIHEQELRDNWRRAMQHETLFRIAPLT